VKRVEPQFFSKKFGIVEVREFLALIRFEHFHQSRADFFAVPHDSPSWPFGILAWLWPFQESLKDQKQPGLTIRMKRRLTLEPDQRQDGPVPIFNRILASQPVFGIVPEIGL